MNKVPDESSKQTVAENPIIADTASQGASVGRKKKKKKVFKVKRTSIIPAELPATLLPPSDNTAEQDRLKRVTSVQARQAAANEVASIEQEI